MFSQYQNKVEDTDKRNKEEESTHNSYHLSSFLALGLFSTRSVRTIVCPQTLVLDDCVPRLLVVSFYILICPSFLFFSATLRTAIIFGALWSLSETILFQAPLRSPATEFLHFLQQSHEKGAWCHTDRS